jgi:SAM-dependent methyltransferase
LKNDTSIEAYKVFSEYYDSYVGKFNTDLNFYRTFSGDRSNRILELGCGTGRILKYLLDLGYSDITGVDISQDMLNKAQAKLSRYIQEKKLRLINHDFSEEKIDDSYNAILITFYTFNYILENAASFLKNVYNSLSDEGILLMDVFYPTTLYNISRDGVWIEKDLNIGESTMRIKDYRKMEDNIERRQQIFDFNGGEVKMETFRKYYRPVELKEYLTKAGFRNIEFSVGYNLVRFEENIDEGLLKENYIIKATK